eukprot:scaffold2991_cov403-Prasinococcus_capsulatus_cf.AAC.6
MAHKIYRHGHSKRVSNVYRAQPCDTQWFHSLRAEWRTHVELTAAGMKMNQRDYRDVPGGSQKNLKRQSKGQCRKVASRTKHGADSLRLTPTAPAQQRPVSGQANRSHDTRSHLGRIV